MALAPWLSQLDLISNQGHLALEPFHPAKWKVTHLTKLESFEADDNESTYYSWVKNTNGVIFPVASFSTYPTIRDPPLLTTISYFLYYVLCVSGVIRFSFFLLGLP